MVKRNYEARGRSSASIDYLLSGKLYCGHCGEKMTGVSGTSKTGKKHYYYKCNSRKNNHSCEKENESKDWLENLVVKTTVEQVLTDENIELIANKAMELIEIDNNDTSELKYYEDELKNTRNQIKNIVDMIANGLSNKSVTDRLTELENYDRDVIANLEYLKVKKPTITRPQIVYWLESFRKGDIDDIEYKKRIIYAFVRSVVVYDTDGGGRRKIVLNFNTTNNFQAELECSTLDTSAPPTLQRLNTIYMSNYAVFSYMIEIESMK